MSTQFQKQEWQSYKRIIGFAFSDIYFNAGTWADRADLNDQMPLIKIWFKCNEEFFSEEWQTFISHKILEFASLIS